MDVRRQTRSIDRLGRALAVALLVGLAGISSPVAAEVDGDTADDVVEVEEIDEDATVPWMPSFAFSFGSYNQKISGDTSTNTSAIPAGTGDSFISEFFEFTGRLHTPLELDIPSKPRLFLSAGIQIPLAEGLIAERVGLDLDAENPPGTPVPGYLDVCPAQIPDLDPLVGLSNTTSCSVTIRNRISIDAMWSAGFGVDFTIEAFESRFHIMPAIEYYGFSAQIEGEFDRASSCGSCSDFEEPAGAVGDPEIFHGISPTVVLGVDVHEAEPWRWGMFLQGRMVFLLNKPNLRAEAPLPGGNSASFKAQLGRTVYQISGGIQVQYTGIK